MPFTLAHPAIVLPLRRWCARLPLDALVIGSMAPDFEYLVRLRPSGSFGHSFLGIILFTLPLAALVVYVARGFLAPRLRGFLGLAPGSRCSAGVVGTLVASLLGILSHVAWDAFTHAAADGMVLLPVLARPVFGNLPVYKLCQYASSILGLGVAGVWGLRWFQTQAFPPLVAKRFCVLAAGLAAGFLGGGGANALRAHSVRTTVSYFAVGGLVGLGVVVLLLALLPRHEARTM